VNDAGSTCSTAVCLAALIAPRVTELAARLLRLALTAMLIEPGVADGAPGHRISFGNGISRLGGRHWNLDRWWRLHVFEGDLVVHTILCRGG
jgi:hypothetical protein